MNNKKYNILGIITARGGSKGIPRKNIKKFCGKPLIAYTILEAKKSKYITDLIISTEDLEIVRVAKKYGANVPFLRPKNLATDKTKHLPVIRHAVSFMEKKLKTVFDYVVILQPTSPLRTVEDIDKTIEKIIKTKADSAVSLVEIEENHPIKIKKLQGNRVLPYCIAEKEGMRRQDLPIAYKRNGSVYVSGRDLIIKKNKLFGNFIVGIVVPKERSVDIDTPLDWMKAEYLFKHKK